MKALVIAGGLPQIELLKQLKSRGISTVLADGSDSCIAKEHADKFICVPIFDVDKVTQIAINESVDFLITVCADQVLLIVAQVSELLGLPCYISYDVAQNVSDKLKMKKIFVENNIPTTRYLTSDNFNSNLVKTLKFPLIVKPVDAYSSKGVRRANTIDELKTYYEEASNISRTHQVIIEEYFEGIEISVDAFVVNGKAQILCISNSEKINDDGRFVIFRGRFPAEISYEIQKQIESITQAIADSFGLINSPLLIQLLSDGKNISVIETCARTGGNMKYLLIKRSCGVNVIDATIDITLGNRPVIEPKNPENKYIVNDFIYCREGVFDHIIGFEQMKKEGYLSDYKVIRQKGFKTHGATSSSDRVVGITIQADSIDDFNIKHKYVVENIGVMDADGIDIMRHELLSNLK